MHECIVGFFQFERPRLMTLENLKMQVAEDLYNYNFIRKTYGGACKKPLSILQQIEGKRDDAGFKRFNYCPVCGKKIDWEKIKEGLQNETV